MHGKAILPTVLLGGRRVCGLGCWVLHVCVVFVWLVLFVF